MNDEERQERAWSILARNDDSIAEEMNGFDNVGKRNETWRGKEAKGIPVDEAIMASAHN